MRKIAAFIIVGIGIVAVTAIVVRKGESGIASRNRLLLATQCLRSYEFSFRGKSPTPIHRSEDGKPLYSWRFWSYFQTPFIPDQFDLYDTIPDRKTPWNEGANRAIALSEKHLEQWGPGMFIDQRRPGNFAGVGCVYGPGTAFDGQTEYAESRKFPVLVVIELRNSNVHWMEPGGDVTIDELQRIFERGELRERFGDGKRGFLVGFANERVRRLSYDVPFDALKPFLLVETAKHADVESLNPWALQD